MRRISRMKAWCGRSGMWTLGILAMLPGCGESRHAQYTFDLAPTTGMLAVDVTNFRGGVEIRADERVDRAEVYATPSIGAALKQSDDGAIESIAVDAALVETGAQAVLKVRTLSDRTDVADHQVDLVIRVPRCEGVRVENSGGLVEVVGTSGGVHIVNHLGPVEFRTNRPMVDPVTITTTDGTIYFQTPVGSAGRIDAHTLEGVVNYRDRVQSTTEAYAAPGVYAATLNEGAEAFVFRTNKGNINLWVDEDPESLTRIRKRDMTDPQDLWFLQGSRRHTRNLPEDHPEVQPNSQLPRPNFYNSSY